MGRSAVMVLFFASTIVPACKRFRSRPDDADMMIDAYRYFRARVLQRMIPVGRGAFDLGSGIEVVGQLSIAAGIAEAARLCVATLRASGHEVQTVDVSPGVQGQSIDRRAVATELRPAIRIIHLNPPLMPRGVLRVGLRDLSRTFNIASWNWELEALPIEWKNALAYVNAIFVPSTFTRDAIAAHTSVPVIVVPHPLREPATKTSVRAAIGIPDHAFLVSSVFNVGSSFERKNPLAVVEAFRLFSAVRPGARLIMKTSGLEAHAADARLLWDAMKDVPGALLVADRWPGEMISGLIADSDCYVSLHRSEGYGLTIAEAITLHTPVVATGWSGNVDFCDPEGTWLVDARQIPVKAEHAEFRGMRDVTWADADIRQAAAHLAAIAADPATAERKAGAAARFYAQWLDTHTYDQALGMLAEASAAGVAPIGRS